MLYWITIVDKRHADNFTYFGNLLRLHNPNITIIANNPLDNICDYLTCSIVENKKLSINDIIQFIMSTKSPMAQLLSLLSNTEFFPKTYKELGYLSYITAELTDHLAGNTTLVIAIENSQESRILLEIRKIARALNIPLANNIIGIYPLQKIFLSRGFMIPNSHLYSCSTKFADFDLAELLRHFNLHYPAVKSEHIMNVFRNSP